ncbi:MAG: ATP/GTP-binding protein [Candidatus Thalassarchaeaceae archaeon]|nr:ATP/GTP-binding protein [Candidatus Thalassarchaeaceae archaeon]MED5398161.1 GTP-binding protein [Candidatus Thermoplasmatota archaeon]
MALELSEIDKLLELAKSGDRRSLSRLMTEIADSEKTPKFHSESIWTLGVTGPPGSGKSTLIGRLAKQWVDMGESVAILALDPSSPISGGSFLADRIRMEASDLGDKVFVRSIASGNTPGGISPPIWPMCHALSLCGWSRIVVETVGTGQSEFRIAALADRLLLVDGPDRGDIIQAEKAGILELADVIAVNKSDLPGASLSAQSIRTSLNLSDDDSREVILVSALEGEGIEKLISAIESCETQSGRNEMIMREVLISEWDSILVSHPEIDEIITKLCDSSITIDEAIKLLRASIPNGR